MNKHYTRLKWLARVKHSSLLRKYVNNSRKKFNIAGSRITPQNGQTNKKKFCNFWPRSRGSFPRRTCILFRLQPNPTCLMTTPNSSISLVAELLRSETAARTITINSPESISPTYLRNAQRCQHKVNGTKDAVLF
jgi:hypothetical protein